MTITVELNHAQIETLLDHIEDTTCYATDAQGEILYEIEEELTRALEELAELEENELKAYE